MFIDTFRMDPKAGTLIPNAMDLLERVAFLVNEYSQEYVNKRVGAVVRINLDRYDRKLMPLVNMLLDKRIPSKVRPFIVAKIQRDSVVNSSEMIITLTDKHPYLVQGTEKEQ